MKKLNVSSLLLLVIGASFSVLVVLLLPRMYFKWDLDTFWKWSLAWNQNWRSVYADCSTCNYPIVGMFFSAGLMGMLRQAGMSYQDAVFNYRLGMGVVDGINILLIYWILKRLDVANAVVIAALTGVSISSWAGGALWGQIDSFSQLFILLPLAWIVQKNTSGNPLRRGYPWYLAAIAALLGLMLLTKQLTIFSSAAFGLLIAADAWFQTRAWKPFLLNMLMFLGSLLLVLFGWDLVIKNVEPYRLHLVYIWMAGTYKPGIISGNGFNIWMLLGRDMWSSAHDPFVDGLPLGNPYLLGEILFLLLMAISTLSLGLFVWGQYRKGQRQLNRELLLNFILYLAWSNLCFNIFLSGTHERYLYHFYPYIFISWMGLAVYSKHFSYKFLPVLIICATLYGLFVLQIMNGISIPPVSSSPQSGQLQPPPAAGSQPQQPGQPGLPGIQSPQGSPPQVPVGGDPQSGTLSHMLLAVIHLLIGFYIFFQTLRYQQFLPNLRKLGPALKQT